MPRKRKSSDSKSDVREPVTLEQWANATIKGIRAMVARSKRNKQNNLQVSWDAMQMVKKLNQEMK